MAAVCRGGQQQRCLQLSGGCEEMKQEAAEVLEVIVDEWNLSNEQKKKYKELKILGRQGAGGVKFQAEGMFFKVAMDPTPERKFGGDDKVMKTAGNEFRHLISLMSCQIPHLHFPLAALIHIRGFMVLVQSELPIGSDSTSSTLKYGSNDGGKTMYNESDTLWAMLQQVR